jgi:MinD superfamily P-loop ATPase
MRSSESRTTGKRRALEPRQLVVLSGKGGTGKTSVVAALATLAHDVVLADCDVDAADLHLVLRPESTREAPFVCGKVARIAPERCSACGLCAEYCRFDAVRMASRNGERLVYEIDASACEGCGLCFRVCTPGAIDMAEAEQGKWLISDTRHGPLVHAELRIGGENSGKLVTVVREQAEAVADQIGAGLVLADGPPGIGCPVIASVTGADLVLAVTEPSRSGVHDLERLAELVQGFGLSLAVCINKADLNRDMTLHIRDVCSARGWPVVGELEYDVAVVQAQVEGESIVEFGDSPVADQISKMWDELQAMLDPVEA